MINREKNPRCVNSVNERKKILNLKIKSILFGK